MKTATFTTLRNNAKRYFDAVERGEIIQVYRNGKPIAVIYPVQNETTKRRSPRPLVLDGVSLSAAILAERKESR